MWVFRGWNFQARLKISSELSTKWVFLWWSWSVSAWGIWECLRLGSLGIAVFRMHGLLCMDSVCLLVHGTYPLPIARILWFSGVMSVGLPHSWSPWPVFCCQMMLRKCHPNSLSGDRMAAITPPFPLEASCSGDLCGFLATSRLDSLFPWWSTYTPLLSTHSYNGHMWLGLQNMSILLGWCHHCSARKASGCLWPSITGHKYSTSTNPSFPLNHLGPTAVNTWVPFFW